MGHCSGRSLKVVQPKEWFKEEKQMENIEILGVAGVAAIAVICYLIGQIVKASGLDNKWIPCIVGACGGALGVAALYVMPEFPAQDVINALAVGIVSGLAATGGNELIKQISKENQ